VWLDQRRGIGICGPVSALQNAPPTRSFSITAEGRGAHPALMRERDGW
jgi:hypothetical protein